MASGGRILLATAGSLGDLHPFIALGLALKARGYRPEIASSPDYRAAVEASGLGFRAVGPDIPRLERELGMDFAAMTRRIMRSDFFLWDRIVLPYLEEATRDLLEAGQGARAVVASTLSSGAAIVCDALDLPRVAVALQPFVIGSAHDPARVRQAPWLRPARGGAQLALNRLTLAIGRRRTRPWDARAAEVRRRLGAPPSAHRLLWDELASADLGLGLFSSVLADRRPDWPASFQVVGEAAWDRPEAELSPELQRFLDGGAPPVVATLGSFAAAAPGDFYAVAAEGARLAGRRLVAVTGERPATASPEGPHVLATPYAPFSKLFPRAAALVQHAGIGSIQQGLRAGLPQLLVPHLGDQFDNAARLERLGGGLVLPRRRFTPEAVAEALGRLPSLQPRAGELGRRVAAENGAEAGADRIAVLLDG